MVTDEDIVRELRAATDWRPADRAVPGDLDYRFDDVRAAPGQVDLRIGQRNGLTARIEISLPSSGTPQYWLYSPAVDAADWLAQFFVWTDEEVLTRGLDTGRILREEHDGASYVVVATYGWQLRDPVEHARLSALAGPHGWNGDQTDTAGS